MNSRDDMVLRVERAQAAEPTARVVAIEQRKELAKKRISHALWHRVLQRALVRRAGSMIGTGLRMVGKAGTSFTEGAIAAGGDVVNLARAGPTGWILGGLAIAAAVGLRLKAGKPLEGIGEDLDEILLGDTADEAGANAAVISRMGSNPLIAGVDRGGKLPQSIRKVAADLRELEVRQRRGARAFRRALPANNTVDLLILAIRDAVNEWVGRNPQKIQETGAMLQKAATNGR